MKFVEKNQNTYFVFSNFFYRAINGNVEKYCGTGQQAQITIWLKRISRWVPKATDKHSEYVTLIPFPLQQWLHERTSMLC